MKRILIIDDADTLAPLLQKAYAGGFEAVVARSGAEALRKIEERAVDGVLVNLMSPVADGASFIRGLGAHHLAIPVVLASRASDVKRLASALGTSLTPRPEPARPTPVLRPSWGGAVFTAA